MKHTIFMAIVTAIGVVGSFTSGPFIGVAVYYFFAVLRPQFLWEWSLPYGVAWSQYVALAALGSTVFAAVGTVGEDDGSLWRYWTKTHLPMVAFFAWLLVSYVFALNRDAAYPWLIEYLKIALMYLVAVTAIRNVRHLWILYVLATIAVCYIAYEINMVYIQFNYLTIWRRGYGGLDNNGAGLIMAMGVPLALAAWEGTQRVWRWAYLIMVVFLIHAVLMSYSRGAMLALILATPLIGALSSQRRRFGIAAVGLLMLLPYLAGQEIRQRFFSVQQYEEDGSAQSRFDSWAAALRIAADYPIAGVGIRNSNLLSFDYGADIQGRTIHSQYLQLAADNGFVGAGLYVTALGMFALATIRTRIRLRRRRDPDAVLATAISNGLLGAMAVFSVGAIFLSLEVFELPFMLLLMGAQISSVVHQWGDAPVENHEPIATASAAAELSWIDIHPRRS